MTRDSGKSVSENLKGGNFTALYRLLGAPEIIGSVIAYIVDTGDDVFIANKDSRLKMAQTIDISTVYVDKLLKIARKTGLLKSPSRGAYALNVKLVSTNYDMEILHMKVEDNKTVEVRCRIKGSRGGLKNLSIDKLKML